MQRECPTCKGHGVSGFISAIRCIKCKGNKVIEIDPFRFNVQKIEKQDESITVFLDEETANEFDLVLNDPDNAIDAEIEFIFNRPSFGVVTKLIWDKMYSEWASGKTLFVHVDEYNTDPDWGGDGDGDGDGDGGGDGAMTYAGGIGWAGGDNDSSIATISPEITKWKVEEDKVTIFIKFDNF